MVLSFKEERMNLIEVSVERKQPFSDTRIKMAFEVAFHEPPVFIRRTGDKIFVSTQLPLVKHRVIRFGSCLGLKSRSITEEHAEIR